MKYLKKISTFINILSLIFIVLIIIYPEIFLKYPPTKSDWTNLLSPPSKEHILGTDELGRDVYSQIILGTQRLLLISLGITFLALITGIFVAISIISYQKITFFIIQLIKIFNLLPPILLLLFIIYFSKYSSANIISIIAIFRAIYLTIIILEWIKLYENKNFYLYAKSLGKKNITLVFQFILQEKISSLINFAFHTYNFTIVTIITFDFLGLSPPNTPSLGNLLAQGWDKLLGKTNSWWLAFFPSLAILFVFYILYTFFNYLKKQLYPQRGIIWKQY